MRFDELGADQSTRRMRGASDHRFSDEAPSPQFVQQFVLRHHPISVFEEVHNQIEDTWLRSRLDPSAKDPSRVRVELDVRETVDHDRWPPSLGWRVPGDQPTTR